MNIKYQVSKILSKFILIQVTDHVQGVPNQTRFGGSPFFNQIINVIFVALHKTLPDWVCYQTIEENKKGNIYLKNCTGVTESQIVRMCKSYLTFSRDRNTAPVYDEPTGHVIGLYNVSYSRTGWQLGTHWTRILDDNEIVLRKDFQFLTFQDQIMHQ